MKRKISNPIYVALFKDGSLQPLVENVTKHGFTSEISIINILISINLNKKEDLVLSVKNSGKKIEISENNIKNTSQKGLEITCERLRLIYGKEFEFYLENIDDNEFNVEAFIIIKKHNI